MSSYVRAVKMKHTENAHGSTLPKIEVIIIHSEF